MRVSVLVAHLGLATVACTGCGQRTAVPAESMSNASISTVLSSEATTDAGELLPACELGARLYEGVPIAAFEDPGADELIVCWADGRVAKSPPLQRGGSAPPPFDRLVFTATLDGEFVELLTAGYGDRLVVTPP